MVSPMGWNTAALFIESPRQVVLEAIASHCKPTARELHFTEASLGKLAPELAIAEIDGWTELWDPSLELSFLPEQEPLRQSLSRQGRVLAVVWSSVASQYGFRLYAHGSLVRAVQYADGNIVDEEGDALPEEADIELPSWGMDEDWAFTIIERLTPIRAAGRNRASYQVLAP
jgi:hypothetical protein